MPAPSNVTTKTSSTDINIGTRILFRRSLTGLQPHAQPAMGGRGLRPVADANDPSPADIERMTREIIAQILRGLADPGLDE